MYIYNAFLVTIIKFMVVFDDVALGQYDLPYMMKCHVMNVTCFCLCGVCTMTKEMCVLAKDIRTACNVNK
jgi:hypothetical protein